MLHLIALIYNSGHLSSHVSLFHVSGDFVIGSIFYGSGMIGVGMVKL